MKCSLGHFLSLLSYLRYASVSLNKQRSLYYGICLLFFSFALLSKAMAVTLPAILLIMDVYPLRRFRVEAGMKSQSKLLIEKLPFFCLSLIYTIITMAFYSERGSLALVEKHPFAQRIYEGFYELLFYLYKMVFPVKLVPYYPYPSRISFLSPEYAGSFIAAVLITVFCVYLWRKNRQVYLAVWVYYIVTLLPVLGIIQVGKTAGADRYAYLPSIGPFLILGLAAAAICEKITNLRKWRLISQAAGVVIAIAALASISYATIQQISVWKNGLVFWNYVIEKGAGVSIAYDNRGANFARMGQLDKAVADYDKAIALNPSHFKAYYNRGVAFARMGQLDKAVADYDKAIALNPSDPEVYNNRGAAFARMGQLGKAVADFDKAIALNPSFSGAYYNLGKAYLMTNNRELAISDFKKACDLGSEIGCKTLQTLR